jgi:hypothetical protein
MRRTTALLLVSTATVNFTSSAQNLPGNPSVQPTVMEARTSDPVSQSDDQYDCNGVSGYECATALRYLEISVLAASYGSCASLRQAVVMCHQFESVLVANRLRREFGSISEGVADLPMRLTQVNRLPTVLDVGTRYCQSIRTILAIPGLDRFPFLHPGDTTAAITIGGRSVPLGVALDSASRSSRTCRQHPFQRVIYPAYLAPRGSTQRTARDAGGGDAL